MDALLLFTRVAIATLMISVHAAGKLHLVLAGQADTFPSIFVMKKPGDSHIVRLFSAFNPGILPFF
ncbi:MAG: hypothetical protein ACO1N1_08010 [Dyadobacter fermentans]